MALHRFRFPLPTAAGSLPSMVRKPAFCQYHQYHTTDRNSPTCESLTLAETPLLLPYSQHLPVHNLAHSLEQFGSMLFMANGFRGGAEALNAWHCLLPDPASVGATGQNDKVAK